ncbi:impB/mucB/samB family protein [Xylariales sp. PMI_506]|nr:impB/mucB/samB family protein [Xylariales sp. PMI_506]
MLISEAQKICPELVIVNGEDLTKFRDTSKKLWSFLRSHSWNKKVERLGLDEVFLDVSDIITYNHQILNRNALATSFFQLSHQDPEQGFVFNATTFFGCTSSSANVLHDENLSNPLCVRLMLASHLAGYLRHKLEEDFGYTSTCGISINKVLAKLAGTKNKPKNQTTLVGLADRDIQQFMDDHPIRKIPGLGFKISHLVENHVLSRTTEAIPHDEENSAKITVREVLEYPGLTQGMLERVLSRPGTERGIGKKIWSLLHGIDDADVKEANDVPTQISIEDTYVTKPINTPVELMRELRVISTSLIRRMRVDLLDDTFDSDETGVQRWLAYPKTLRLSTRVKAKPGPEVSTRDSFSRSSRSQPLPNFVLNIKDSIEEITERLIHEAVVPLFRRLHNERHNWNLSLINICVTNMVLTSNDEGQGVGRDISTMFKTQDAKLKEFTVYDETPLESPAGGVASERDDGSIDDHAAQESDAEVASWEDNDEESWDRCSQCGHAIPAFAMAAHERFHSMSD